MIYYLKIFLFFIIFINSNGDAEEQKNKETETKKQTEKKTQRKKAAISRDMTHGMLFFLGKRHELKNNLYAFFGVNTALYSDIYQSEIPKEEYQYSAIRTAHLEFGVTYEFCPFWGVSVSLYSKEFLNGGASNNKFISGGRFSLFYHYGSLFFESGFVIKENMNGILGEKNKYGFSLVFSIKFVKDSISFGSMILL
ncbi:hypothetical protein [Alphaproteobacteria bacterium endosymbiont of Tiliacea citrago]|uniref:hypothetical protein n=1 Tax=Alphaproteobacteria bacterium endosymbiont of Tiliacea citrago TaxID=3077944 RepID=UPI00313B6DA0